MKFEELNIGDNFKSDRYENLVFQKVQEKGRTCCTPAYNAMGVGHNTKVLFAQADEVILIQKEV